MSRSVQFSLALLILFGCSLVASPPDRVAGIDATVVGPWVTHGPLGEASGLAFSPNFATVSCLARPRIASSSRLIAARHGRQ